MEKTLENTAKPEAGKSIGKDKEALIERMFNVGAQYGYSKSRRHPSAKPYIFGAKNNTEIFDLEKTSDTLKSAKEFVKEIASQGKQIMFISSKPEAREFIKNGAESINQPYVAGRWIGGTLTNSDVIKKRIDRLADLESKKEKGELGKYTKKEQLLLTREIEALTDKFGGISNIKGTPGALFVIDMKKEDIAVEEAKKKGVPVVTLSSNDCDISSVEYPILGNDSARKSVEFFVYEIVEAYKSGQQKSIK